ncbi:MAG: hypothetical protein NTZ93_01155 [Candidatus Beckwithbacteria bacterium]|nr:hypothetical protein [Candidatus Beckwithbacteria bacterium]
MKKELLIAVVIGLSLGLIVALGIFTANQALNTQKQKKSTQTSTSPITTITNQQKTLNITSPENFDLINQSDITLSGIAWPNAVIALLTETQSYLTLADSEGIFTFKIKLIKGFNEITIIASDETGFTQTQNLVLTYSTSIIQP